MSTTAHPAAAPLFMVIGTIRADTNLADIAALRAAEQQQLAVLHAEGRVGAHHVAFARRTVFLEVMAADEQHVMETLATLPFAKFFDLDIYPTSPPAAPDGAPRAQS